MKYAHLSIDDTEAFFVDLISNEERHKHLIDSNLINHLHSLHSCFGACFTLYGYNTIGKYHISDVPTEFKTEFEKYSSWLKFGFHWRKADYDEQLDDDSVLSDCKEVYNAVESFAGQKSFSSTIRLHYFHCSFTLYDKLSLLKPFVNGLTLLCPDTSGRKCYDLNDVELLQLYHNGHVMKNGRYYICSTLRVEKSSPCSFTGNYISVFHS